FAGGKTVVVWDPETRKVVARLAGHQDNCRAAAFTPSGQALATGDDKGSIHLWGSSFQGGPRFKAHDGMVMSVAITPQAGGVILSVGTDSAVKVWDLGGRLVRRLGDASVPARRASLSRNGRRAVVVGLDSAVRVFDVTTGEQLWRWVAHPGTWVADAVF